MRRRPVVAHAELGRDAAKDLGDLTQLADHRLGQLAQPVLLAAQQLGQAAQVGAPLVHDLVSLSTSALDVTRRLGLGAGDDLGGHLLGAVHDLVHTFGGRVDNAPQLRAGAPGRRSRLRAALRPLRIGHGVL